METKTTTQILTVPQPEVLKRELFPSGSKLDLTVAADADLDAKAQAFVDQLVNFTPGEISEEQDKKVAVEQMGQEVQRRTAKQSELLRQPISKMSEKSGDGGPVANALIDLKVQVEDLDPGKFDFEPGWFSRTMGRLPGVGTPLKRYFSKFESAQTVISTIIRSLEDGRAQLERDNVTLVEDQKQLRDSTKKLERAIQLGLLMDQKLQYKLDRELQPTDPKHRFVAEELLFPLRQRVMDLQQQLAVAQQGVIAIEIIMRNNKELVRGVNRSLNVTVSALETAATVAMALANQKIVLDKINAVSKTTSDLIAGTASRLKTQGVDIQKQASTSQLNLDSLKSAFADLKTAMDDVSSFRVNALPQMAKTILELNEISKEAEKNIQKLEEGNRSRPQIRIEAE